jgi:predicted DsbA family dithiol-disulfide isomerase
MTLTIDVISDVICPWCFVGKRRLEKAVHVLARQREVRVRWHPFQLNPRMPKEGMDRKEYRTGKFGSLERSQALDTQMKETGATEGIAFNFDKMARTPNTLDAHRLILLAGEQNVQDAVVEALFRAYFTDGRDIGQRDTLLDVASEAGLMRERAVELLNSGEDLEVIRAAEERAQRLGVQGVPFFVIDDKLALSGAQKPEAFLAAFDRLHTPTLSGGTGVCEVDSGRKPKC